MKLSSYLFENQIVVGIKHKRKSDIFKELLVPLSDSLKINPSESVKIVNMLLEREKLNSTAIGQGIAIPHARVDGISMPLLVVGVASKGLDFDSLDGQPVYVFFMILSPKNEAGMHLKLLATISKLLRDKYVIEKIARIVNPAQLIDIILKQEAKI